MIYLVLALLAGLAIGFLPLPFGVTIVLAPAVVLAIAYAWPRFYVAYLWPAKLHESMLALVDPTAGPPPGSLPTDFVLLEHLDELAGRREWKALRALLTEDFTLVDAAGKRYGGKFYVCSLQNQLRMYPDLRQQTEAVVADPYEPEVYYVCSRTLGRPRRGPAADHRIWTRFVLAPGGERVREIASAGVLSVA